MILCDPFAINTLALSTIRHLQDLVGQDTLPRVSVAACAPDPSYRLNSIAFINKGLALQIKYGSVLKCVCKLI